MIDPRSVLELTHEEMERYDKGIEQFNKRMREQETERMEKEAQAANKHQIGGSHYMKAIQPWDYIAANQLGYFEGNVVKYVTRWKDKGGINDLMKAKHYIEKLIELETGK